MRKLRLSCFFIVWIWWSGICLLILYFFRFHFYANVSRKAENGRLTTKNDSVVYE